MIVVSFLLHGRKNNEIPESTRNGGHVKSTSHGNDDMPTVIVLCPVRNEAWILHKFLSVASQIADRIIVADQLSTDRSREICALFKKVTLIDNPYSDFNEKRYREILMAEARKSRGRRLLLALDADEILSSNILDSPEWKTALKVRPGTTIAPQRVILWKSPLAYKSITPGLFGEYFAVGYMDDDAPYEAEHMHSTRFPLKADQEIIYLNEIVVMHYQAAAFQRIMSKNRWYRSYERINDPDISSIKLNRFYSQYLQDMGKIPTHECPASWHEGWKTLGIDTTSIAQERYFWWDWEVLRMFREHGTQPFLKDDIWCADWEEIRKAGQDLGITGLPQQAVQDPRSKLDRFLTAFCRRTQRTGFERLADVFLRSAGR